MTPPLVSIVVPVWNTARFLPECLDSLLRQTLHNIEILCVDDASTDDSLQVLQRYAAADPRIRVFPLETSRGPGGARNLGSDQARSDFIGFVDSDDLVSPGFFENLYRGLQTHNADIVFTSYTVFDESTREIAFGGDGTAWQRLRHSSVHNVRGLQKAFGPGWDHNRDFSDHRVDLAMFPTVVNKLYRRSLLKKARFLEGILYEDLLFMPQVLHHARRVYSCQGGEYYYRRNPASITHRKSYDDLLQKIVVAGVLDQWVRQQMLEPAEQELYEELVRRKYRQGITSLVKSTLIWSPERLRAVTKLVPETMVSLFYLRLFCRWSPPTVTFILIVWFAANMLGR